MVADEDLERLLDFNGTTYEVGGGFWAKIEVRRVEPDQGRPLGISYSLTLHDADGDRVLGYDNAHAPPRRRGKGKKNRPAAYDHLHRGKKTRPYAFKDVGTLVDDFWDDIENFLKRRGVP